MYKITKKCAYCGNKFEITERRFNAKKYCCTNCSKKARQDNNRIAVEKYNKKVYRIQKENVREAKEANPEFQEIDNKFLGNSNLDEHAENDFEKEFKEIEKELKRLKLKRYIS